jgi:hypothetical protein
MTLQSRHTMHQCCVSQEAVASSQSWHKFKHTRPHGGSCCTQLRIPQCMRHDTQLIFLCLLFLQALSRVDYTPPQSWLRSFVEIRWAALACKPALQDHHFVCHYVKLHGTCVCGHGKHHGLHMPLTFRSTVLPQTVAFCLVLMPAAVSSCAT